MAHGKIIFILDMSGSMHELRADTIGSFNTLVADQRTIEGDCRVTLVTFSTGPHTLVLDDVPLEDVVDLTEDKYVPGGGTALLDAVGGTLSRLREQIEVDEPETVSVVIITDGAENASRTWDKDKVKSLVQDLEAKDVEFSFLGANIDAFSEGYSLGVASAKSIAYSATSRGVEGAYSAISAKIKGLRSGGMTEDFSKQMADGLENATLGGTGTENYDKAAIQAALKDAQANSAKAQNKKPAKTG